jgi:predicted Zn-dependent protease
MGAERRAEALRQAAQAKHQAATKRAEAALRKLIKSGEEINFRTVATAAGVSVDFLYRHPQLRQRIEHLRARQQKAPAAATPQPGPADRGVVVALTARLREARSEVAELKAQLAAAHGELLALRRQLPQPVLCADKEP